MVIGIASSFQAGLDLRNVSSVAKQNLVLHYLSRCSLSQGLTVQLRLKVFSQHNVHMIQCTYTLFLSSLFLIQTICSRVQQIQILV